MRKAKKVKVGASSFAIAAMLALLPNQASASTTVGVGYHVSNDGCGEQGNHDGNHENSDKSCMSDADKAKADKAKADADKAKADLAALQASDTATQAELDKFKAAFSQAVDQNRTLTAERDQLKALLATQTTISQTCDAKNQRLTTFAEGLLDRYNHVTLGEKLMAREPVFGFDRVHLENIAQEREDTIRGAHCDPRLDAIPQKTATK